MDTSELKANGNNLPSLKIGDCWTLNTNNFIEAFGYSLIKDGRNGSKAENQQHKLLREEGYTFTIKPIFDHSRDTLYEKKGNMERALQYVNEVIHTEYNDGREYFLRANIYMKKL